VVREGDLCVEKVREMQVEKVPEMWVRKWGDGVGGRRWRIWSG
jgi:hypothetical protein